MLTVTGASDDLIEIDGDISEEFARFDSSEGDYLAFSDGTVLKAVYDDNGIWRFNLIYKGSLYLEKVEGVVAEDTNDIIKFADGITWCVCGPDLAK